MKRNLKNTITIIIILIMSCAIFFTINYAKNSTSNQSNMNEKMGDNTPPSQQENNSNNKNIMDPPDNNPNNNQQNQNGVPNNKNENSNNENQENDTENENQQKQDSNTNIQPSENNNQNNNGNTPPSVPNSKPEEKNNSKNNIYLILQIESLILIAAVMYLIMSDFNKKNIKETFKDKDKILIYALSIIVVSQLLTNVNKIIIDKISTQNKETSISYSSKKEINKDETITKGNYNSTSSDENAITATGNIKAAISNTTTTKEGDSDGGDNTSFYGTNSAFLAKNGADLTLNNITVKTSATGANGVFCYGGQATTNNTSSDNTTITIKNSKITTTKDNSGGIMTTGGGIMKAYNLDVTTSGISSAAIRSDRGGGTVTVNKGTYKTTGQGSPAIYSTAQISVKNAKLISESSEGIIIEGKNSVAIDNVELTDTNNKLNGKSTTYKNIFLYQSMSEDASAGTSTFTAKNSKITTNKGDTFYITNQTATINLENNTIKNNDSTGNFLRAQKDSWGNNGSNGGNVKLTMTNQRAIGNIVIDSISTLEMNLKEKSYYEGSINSDNTAKSIKLTLDKTSKIKLTKDSYITSLDNKDQSNSNIDFNGYKLYVNNVAIN